jgi:hypothetical protein
MTLLRRTIDRLTEAAEVLADDWLLLRRDDKDYKVSASTLKAGKYQELTEASPIEWDWSKGHVSELRMTADGTLNIINDVAGDMAFLGVYNDASVDVTITMPANVVGATSVTLSVGQFAYIDWRSTGAKLWWLSLRGTI